MYSGRSSKSAWILIFLMLAGIVLFGYIGQGIDNLAHSVDALSFLQVLNYKQPFGISPPFTLDLGIISATLGFNIQFTLWGILGVIVAIIVYRKL